MDVRAWFDEDDLEECPRCRKRTAIKNPTPLGGWVVCINCGIVGVRADKTGAA
jgi:hypothetical protein